ncbi:MAG: hypothetical protein U5O16_40515 [Rhodococcus sp. (in: high G+C Gram-positive bacteria)]|uniref:hypothetical protein n=1 Tax=Rhodococcus sp. TaxID=1831 RepID=UPI002ADA7B72|nr:hypothetical protein [Rhodococcus sp. (in: high G+C Gram-positive bacteria)]
MRHPTDKNAQVELGNSPFIPLLVIQAPRAATARHRFLAPSKTRTPPYWKSGGGAVGFVPIDQHDLFRLPENYSQSDRATPEDSDLSEDGVQKLLIFAVLLEYELTIFLDQFEDELLLPGEVFFGRVRP